MTPKKIPVRMCTGCGEGKPKKELIRIVKNASGDIFPDFTGKAQGRGAYICKNSICLKKAMKTRRLERTFGCEISSEVYGEIEKLLAEGTKS